MMGELNDQAFQGIPLRIIDDSVYSVAKKLPSSLQIESLAWKNAAGEIAEAHDITVRLDLSTDLDDSFQDQQKKKSPAGWWRRPYVQMYFSSKPDYDVLKDKKSRLSEFIESCTAQNVEWLLVYVLRSTRDDGRNEKRAIEKIKTYLGASKGKDRCVLLSATDSGEIDASALSELKESLRTYLSDAIEKNIVACSEQTARIYSSRILPGWPFCQYVIVSEGLVFIYMQLRRFDLAVSIYRGLEQIMVDRAEAGAEFLSLNEAFAVDIVDPSVKQYRQRINSGTISEVDLRTFLFASQADLLLKDERVLEVGEKGAKFLETMQSRCMEEVKKSNYSSALPHLWGYLAAWSLIERLDREIAQENSTSNSNCNPKRVSRAIAGFYQHVLNQFRQLCAIYLPGFLSDDSNGEVAQKDRDLVKLSLHEKLREALQDREKAEELYTELVLLATKNYERGGLPRFANRLRMESGRLLLERGYNRRASELLAGACSHFAAANGWDHIHSMYREKLAHAEKQQGKVREYLLSCMALLRASRLDRQVGSYDENVFAADAAKWFAEAKNAAEKLPTVMSYNLKHLFDVKIRPQNGVWTEGLTATATVVITSAIRCPLTFGSLVLKLTEHKVPDYDPHLLKLSKKSAVVIDYGENEIAVTADDVPDAREFRFSTVSLILGKLKLSIQDVSRLGSFGVERLPRFFCISAAPLQTRMYIKNDLVLVNGRKNYIYVDLQAGEMGFSGTVEVAAILMENEGLKRDVEASVNLLDAHKGAGPELTWTEEVNIDPGSTRSVPIPLLVDGVAPRWMSTVRSERSLLEIDVKAVVTMSFIRSGKPKTLMRKEQNTFEMMRPLRLSAVLIEESSEKPCLAVTVLNQSVGTMFSIVSFEFESSLKMIEEDGLSRLQNSLLPFCLAPGSSVNLVHSLLGSPSAQEGGEISTYRVNIGEANGSLGEVATIEGLCDISSLRGHVRRFQVSRKVPLMTTIGMTVHMQYRVRDSEKSARDETYREQNFLYEVIPDFNWAVSGRRRARLTSTTVEGQVELVPLCSGILRLPQMRVLELHANGHSQEYAVEAVDDILQVQVIPLEQSVVACEPQSSNADAFTSFLPDLGVSLTELSNNDIGIERLSPT